MEPLVEWGMEYVFEDRRSRYIRIVAKDAQEAADVAYMFSVYLHENNKQKDREPVAAGG